MTSQHRDRRVITDYVEAPKLTNTLDDATALGQLDTLDDHPSEMDYEDDLVTNLFDRDADPEEYDYAWGRILEEFGDFGCWHEGEAWQYMGSSFEDGRWHHDFRHRFLPDSDGYTRRSYPASVRWHNERSLPNEQIDESEESYRVALSTALDGEVEVEVWLALTQHVAFVNGALRTLELAKGALDEMEGRLP